MVLYLAGAIGLAEFGVGLVAGSVETLDEVCFGPIGAVSSEDSLWPYEEEDGGTQEQDEEDEDADGEESQQAFPLALSLGGGLDGASQAGDSKQQKDDGGDIEADEGGADCRLAGVADDGLFLDLDVDGD